MINFKHYLFLAVIMTAFFTSKNLYSQKSFIELSDGNEMNFYRILELKEQEWEGVPVEKRKGYKQFKRWEHFWYQRTYPTGKFPEGTDIFNEFLRTESYMKDNPTLLSKEWQAVGPFNVPNASDEQRGIGRVNVIRLNPNNENEIWLGSASGGLWRSKDAGASWETFDFTQFLSLGISDIAINKSNPNIIYVATGDVYGSASTRDFYSIGLIKTTNAGQTWEITGLRQQLSDKKHVCKIVINPLNPETIVVATSEGIYKSYDGGTNWELKSEPRFFIDLKANPANPDILYASSFSLQGNGFIFISEDGGETWQNTFNSNNTVRIALAVTPAEPNLVYAVLANRSNYGFHSLIQSTDAGKNWETIANPTSTGNILGWYTGSLSNDAGGQGQYDLCIAVSPTNSREVYVGGINIWRSNNSGKNFSRATHWVALDQNFPYVHADIHEMVYNATGNVIYSANDGGIYRSTNFGNTWTSISNGLNITQFYRIGVSQKDVSLVFVAGAQDNGTKMHRFNQWNKISGSDGMECIIDPLESSRIYVSYYEGTFLRSINSGNSFGIMLSKGITNESAAWTTPLILNPQRPATLFAGYNNVWVSRNYGASGSWSRLSTFNSPMPLIALACSPADTNVIYAASINRVYATYDNGKTWNTIYNSDLAITYIWADELNSKRLWISKSGFGSNDKIIELNDGDEINLTGNLPNVPVNCIIKQPDSPDRLYIGTDIGVYYTDFASAHWQRLGSGLPNVIVYELEIHKSTNKLVAATYGRGVWTTDLIICDGEQPKIKALTETSICPDDFAELSIDGNYSNYRWSNGETTPTIKVNQTGHYSLIITDNDGCEIKSKSIFVDVDEIPTLDIQAANGNFICENGEATLMASGGFERYEWSNGKNDRIITIDQPGSYYVTAFTQAGCQSTSETIIIEQKPAPQKPFITMNGSTLTAPEANAYQWYLNGNRLFFERKQTLEIKSGQVGNYQVEVFNEAGCSSISEPFEVLTNIEENITLNKIIINKIAKSIFELQTPSSINQCRIDLLDYTGKTVFSSEYSNHGIITLDFSDQPPSVYFIKVSTKEKVYKEKIIIE